MGRWTNWDGSLHCDPAEILKPSSTEEVSQIVRQAHKEGRTVRAVGAGHSWSPLVPTDGIILSLDAMSTALQIDEERRLAKLEAGIRLHEIGPLLWKFNLSMANLGAITQQSLAGAVATGTHGTGLRYGVIGTQIIAMKIVDGRGDVHEFNADNHPNEMAALRLNLGCLGIVTEMTIACVPANHVDLVHYKMSLKDCLASIEKLYSENERVRFYWFPGSDELFVNTMDQTAKPDADGPVFSWFEAKVLREELMGALWSMGNHWPSLVGALNKFQEVVGYTKGSVVGPCYEAITTPVPPHHQECEVAVPVSNARAAIEAFDKLVRDNDLIASVPSEIRFVKQDDTMISPCNASDVCFIGAYTATAADREKLFSMFTAKMKEFGGRPHWGKFGAPDRAEAMAIYPRFGEFAAMRERFDPDKVFANDYIRELFAL